MPSSRRALASPGTVTIAELPGSIPIPARKRFASPTSCWWIASIPTASSSSSAGTEPTQENQGGGPGAPAAGGPQPQRRPDEGVVGLARREPARPGGHERVEPL